MRIAKVPSMQSNQVADIEDGLKNMGSAAYAILPIATEIEIVESKTTDAHEVFERKMLFLNAETSKLYLGQTMTTDEGGSLSQSQTHSQTEQQVLHADQVVALGWMNQVLLPALKAHGFILAEGDRIDIPEAVDPERRLEQDKMLLNAGVSLSKDYLERTYDVEIDDTSKQADEEETETKKTQRLFLSLKKKLNRQPLS